MWFKMLLEIGYFPSWLRMLKYARIKLEKDKINSINQCLQNGSFIDALKCKLFL